MKTLKIKSLTLFNRLIPDSETATHENCIAYVAAKLAGEGGRMRATVSVARDKAGVQNHEWLTCCDFWMDGAASDTDILDEFKRLVADGQCDTIRELAL